MDKKTFEDIISKGESSSLDFKSKLYDVMGDSAGDITAEFIKDIISMTNTIRKDSAFIVIGIEELSDGTKVFHGLDKYIDDAIFQQKIKDKINPKPVFSYSIFEYNSTKYGIFEIPVQSYSEPLTPVKNLKGLEKGKVYFRRGTSNSEASVPEIIRINDWFRKVKKIEDNPKLDKSNMTNILASLNNIELPLGPTSVELLKISKDQNNKTSIDFFENERNGWDPSKYINMPNDLLNFRKLKVIVSPVQIKRITTTTSNVARNVYHDLLKREDSGEVDIIYNAPISTLDSEIAKMKNDGFDNIYSQKKNAQDFFGKDSRITGEFMLYYLFDNYANLKNNIRLKYLSELMNLMK